MLETPFPFFISKKPGEIPIFGTFLPKKNWFFFSILVYIFTENPLFESGHVWKHHCDVIRWPIFMILVSMERGDPTLYHGTKQSNFGPVNFKFIRGVVTTPSLGKPCYKKKKKAWYRTRVKCGLWSLSDWESISSYISDYIQPTPLPLKLPVLYESYFPWDAKLWISRVTDTLKSYRPICLTEKKYQSKTAFWWID